jgi:hypothetical protein
MNKFKVTLLSVVMLSACGSVFAEKFLPEIRPELQRIKLDMTDRVANTIMIDNHVPNTSVFIDFTINQGCCNWFFSTCNDPYIDTKLILNGPSPAVNDDDRCFYLCQFGPSVIGHPLYGDGCLIPGTYSLEIYMWSYYDENCMDTGIRSYPLTMDFCDEVADSDIHPVNLDLGQNYPNPFNPVTNIEYSVTENGYASLSVYDISGDKVAALVDGMVEKGTHTVNFDASHLSSGVYFYTLQAEGVLNTRKMILMK